MNKENEIKNLVKEKYGSIAVQSKEQNESSCCGSTGCSDELCTIMSDDYSKLEGYNPDADLGLGCGIPTEYAKIREGDVVVDLGSGAGNDAFVTRRLVGDSGKVIGVDFTESMIAKARANAEKINYNNVEFRLGDIEDLPVASNKADVILSNCVLNLVPNKHKVFSEIFRVLKPGGHFSISDIVIEGIMPDKLKKTAELYVGCVAGAIQKKDYLSIIEEAGFTNITIHKEKNITLPDEILLAYITGSELDNLKNSGPRIFSITVSAEKPAKDQRNCCEPGSGCC